jgi:phage recombination protein Bet
MSEVITVREVPGKRKLVEVIADRYGVDAEKMLSTLKATAFKTEKEITNEQMMALLVVADQYGLNPFTREIFAFPSTRGIVPVVGVDGWSRIINTHDGFDGMDFNQSDKFVEHEKGEHKPCPEWIECAMYRKDRSHPVVAREYFDECYRGPFVGKNGVVIGPWQTHTKRFLRHKAMIQAARIAFGFVGIYDQDEAERIREIDVTPRSTSVVSAVIEHGGAVFDEAARDEYVEAVDSCFTLDPAEGLQLVEQARFDEIWEKVSADADLKIGVWEKLPSKVRTFIKGLERA